MDIYCTRCGDAWDMDTLHDVVDERIKAGMYAPLDKPSVYYGPEYDDYSKKYAVYYNEVRDDFYSRGCESLTGWNLTCEKHDGANNRAMLMSAMVDMLGDDLDGIASMMDDADFMGLI